MLENEFTDTIKITKSNGESIELDQKRIRIREKENGLMALSYVAPVFESMDIEDFFDDIVTSEEVMMDIGGTGDYNVRFRGLVDGKGKNFPQNFEHKIILLQEPKYLDPRMNVQVTGFARFIKPEERFLYLVFNGVPEIHCPALFSVDYHVEQSYFAVPESE